MKRFQATLTAFSLLLTTAFCLNTSATKAATFTVDLNNDPTNLTNGLFGDTTGIDASSFKVQTIGNAQAFGTFRDDPFGLKSGVVLSTGKVTDLPGKNQCYNSCTDLKSDFAPLGTTGDTIQLRLDFLNDTAGKLFFQYVFGSEELPEWAGSQFNDRFSLELNGKNLAYLSDGKNTEVNINNLARSTDVILNPPSTGFASNETKLDGYSKPLLFTGDLQQGLNTLLITIADRGDGIYDSAVFLKAGTLGTVKPPGISGIPSGCSAIPIGGGFGLSRDVGNGLSASPDAGTPNCTSSTGGIGGTDGSPDTGGTTDGGGSGGTDGGGASGGGNQGGASEGVPEPSSIAGTFLTIVLGGGFWLKRRRSAAHRALDLSRTHGDESQ